MDNPREDEFTDRCRMGSWEGPEMEASCQPDSCTTDLLSVCAIKHIVCTLHPEYQLTAPDMQSVSKAA